jgi:hypothetical protein
MKACKFGTIMAVVCLFGASLALADVPNSINFHGMLADSTGAPLNETISVQFSIYLDASGGSAQWSETDPDVEVSDGGFDVYLGSINPLPGSLFTNSDLWLQLAVNGETLSPRQKLASVPYGFRSAESDHATVADTASIALTSSPDDDWTVSGDDIYRASGNVGIGTTTPSTTLDVHGNVNADSSYQIAGSKVLSAAPNSGTLVGIQAGGNATSFADATFVGYQAGHNNQGYSNTFVGKGAGLYNTTGFSNTFIGRVSGFSNINGYWNTFVGQSSGSYNTSGNYNSFLGVFSGDANTTGNQNTFVGHSAGHNNQIGSRNVCLGYSAGYYETGSDKLYIANGSLINNVLLYGDFATHKLGIAKTSATRTLDVGGNVSTDSSYQIAGETVLASPAPTGILVGRDAGRNATTTFDGTMIGYRAGYNNQAAWNTFVGATAGQANTTGSGNTLVGFNAGAANVDGQENLFVGESAGNANVSGDNNTFIGPSAGYSNTSNNNTFVGNFAGYFNTSGSGNVFLGSSAGYNETGSNKMYIANGSASSNVLMYGDFSSRRVGIGTLTPETSLHVEGTVTVDQKIEADDAGGLELATDDGVTRLIVADNGNVGIGVSDPDSKLEVAASFKLSTGAGEGAGFRIEEGQDQKWALLYRPWASSNLSIYDDDGFISVMNFQQNTGRIGINTLSPHARLEIAAASDTALYVIRTDGTKALLATQVNGIIAHCTYPGGQGVYGYGSGYAGFFQGDVYVYNDLWVNGTLHGGRLRRSIDHPLDPENKILNSNFVQSNENLQIYRGKTRLNSQGESVVTMPDYFTALSKEDKASIHVTPVGRPFLSGAEWNVGYQSLTIYGDPDREVFWEVLAECDDPVARQSARPVEEMKGPDTICDRGKLLDPTAYGYPESKAKEYDRLDKDVLNK